MGEDKKETPAEWANRYLRERREKEQETKNDRLPNRRESKDNDREKDN